MSDCPHRDTAPAGRLSGRLSERADTAVAGLFCETVISHCTDCGGLVAGTELRRSRNAPPLYVTPPVALRAQRKAGPL